MVLEIEAAGFEVLGGLLGHFVPAMQDTTKYDDAETARRKKYFQLVPPVAQERLRERGATGYERLLCITDVISGMTDSYAISVFKKIRGISLPGG